MNELIPLLLIAALGLIGWFWFDSLRAREHALKICAQACDKINAQLLDDTVALRRLGVARDKRGHAVWRRTYNFEYSLDGAERLRGSVTMRGRAVEIVAIQSPEGGTQFEQD